MQSVPRLGGVARDRVNGGARGVAFPLQLGFVASWGGSQQPWSAVTAAIAGSTPAATASRGRAENDRWTALGAGLEPPTQSAGRPSGRDAAVALNGKS